jgi:hypothetical protein
MAYGSDGGFDDWLSARGHTLPDAAPSQAVLRQRASDYIDAVYGPRFSGTDGDAAFLLARIEATYAAAWYEANNLNSLAVAASTGGSVRREKVDVLEVEYRDGSGDALKDAIVRLTLVEGILAPWLISRPEPAIFVV